MSDMSHRGFSHTSENRPFFLLPPRTVHKLFCEEQLQLLKDKIPNSKERLVQANKLWWKLSAKEKERLKAKLDVKMKKYAVVLQRWFEVH